MKQKVISMTNKTQNNLISWNHKKVFTDLNYIEQSLILASAITATVTISVFASLSYIPINITSFPTELKLCLIIAGIKNYESIIEKKKKEHDKILLLQKDILHTTEFLFSKHLIDWSIIHDEFASVNNVLRE